MVLILATKGVFRRDDRMVVPATKERMQEQLQREAQHSHLVKEAALDFGP